MIAGHTLPRATGKFKLGYGGTAAQEMGAREQQAYFEATGKDPFESKFNNGLARAQWAYGIRGGDYWAKDKRQGVLMLSEVQ